MTICVHRLEYHRLSQPWIGCDHLFDAEDLHLPRMAAIGHNRVLVARLIQKNGFGRLRKQVNCRSASKTKCPLIDAQFKHLLPLWTLEARKQKHDLSFLAESGMRQRFEPIEIKEKILFRQCEIFL